MNFPLRAPKHFWNQVMCLCKDVHSDDVDFVSWYCTEWAFGDGQEKQKSDTELILVQGEKKYC